MTWWHLLKWVHDPARRSSPAGRVKVVGRLGKVLHILTQPGLTPPRSGHAEHRIPPCRWSVCTRSIPIYGRLARVAIAQKKGGECPPPSLGASDECRRMASYTGTCAVLTAAPPTVSDCALLESASRRR